jgi:hypothetical protein
MNAAGNLDLIMLVPGMDERECFDALLSSRRPSLGIRAVRYKILVHTRRDSGCFHEAPAVLQPFLNRANYCLVVLDHEGSGQEKRPASDVAADLKKRLEDSGWKDRAEVLVLEPELESWVWSDSPHVDEVLGWAGHQPDLRQWLKQRGLWTQGAPKPNRPKECLEAALRQVRVIRSSAIYRELAERVGLERCKDRAFHAFKRIVQAWFAESPLP